MQKNVFRTWLFSILLIAGLLFAGCSDSDDGGGGGNTDPKSIKITGLSSITGEVFMTISTDDAPNNGPARVAVSNRENLSNQNEATFKLYFKDENAPIEPSASEWTGSGSYYIILFCGERYVSKDKKNISDALSEFNLSSDFNLIQ